MTKTCTRHRQRINNNNNTVFCAVSAAETINNDVSIGTGGQIKDFLTPSALTNAVFVLINAVYFRGTWQSKFDTRDTTKQVRQFSLHKGEPNRGFISDKG